MEQGYRAEGGMEGLKRNGGGMPEGQRRVEEGIQEGWRWDAGMKEG